MWIEIPEYYQKFSCIGSRCTDNCCIGWEIDIDEDTLQQYQKIQGEFGTRLHDSIVLSTPPHFRLYENRCPFLNEDNLCDIIRTLGEDQLCEICDKHPRFFTQCGNRISMGIGLCCEAAAKLILEQKTPTRFFIEETQEKNEDHPLSEWLFYQKQRAIRILQNRTQSIPQRLIRLLYFAERIQEQIELERYDFEIQIPVFLDTHYRDALHGMDCLRDLLVLYEELEPLDVAWPEHIKDLRMHLEELTLQYNLFLQQNSFIEQDYEQLAVYFIHRYWMHAGKDYDVLGKVHFMLASICMIRLFDVKIWACEQFVSRERQIQLVKAYSQEIEYSEDNLEILAEASLSHSFFQTENLVAAILWTATEYRGE